MQTEKNMPETCVMRMVGIQRQRDDGRREIVYRKLEKEKDRLDKAQETTVKP